MEACLNPENINLYEVNQVLKWNFLQPPQKTPKFDFQWIWTYNYELDTPSTVPQKVFFDFKTYLKLCAQSCPPNPQGNSQRKAIDREQGKLQPLNSQDYFFQIPCKKGMEKIVGVAHLYFMPHPLLEIVQKLMAHPVHFTYTEQNSKLK